MPESPMLSHCSSRSLLKNLNLAIYTYQRDILYQSGSVTALTVTNNLDCRERCTIDNI